MRFLAIVLLTTFAACTDEASQMSDEPPTPGAAYEEEAVAWFLREISDDGRRIEIVYHMSGVASGCEREGDAHVTETADRVVIEQTKRVTTDRTRPCTEELAYVDNVVTLDAPLGDRALSGCDGDEVCRDLGRSREAGVFEFSPTPSP